MNAPTLRINSRIAIPRSEFRFAYVRSSGPGGQNVNKVNSKVQLHWPVAASGAIPEDLRERILARLKPRLTEAGELLVVSQRYRDQRRNIDDCLAKLREMVLVAATPPRRRKKTKVPRSAREDRLKEKKAHAEKKRRRARPAGDD
jgi:ribosome-associated protein